MRNFYYLVNDNVVMEEEDFMDKVYELVDSRLTLDYFFGNWLGLTCTDADRLVNFCQRNDFYIYDTPEYQDWEQEVVEDFIQDETEFFSVDTDGDVYWLDYDEFIIGTWEEVADELFELWENFWGYMKTNYPEVAQEDYDKYQDEYEKWEYSNISAYMADHAKKI